MLLILIINYSNLILKGELGPPQTPTTHVNQQPFNPATPSKTFNNPPPPIINPPERNYKMIPPPGPAFSQNKPNEQKTENIPPPLDKSKVRADFHPPIFTPPMQKTQPIHEIKPNPINNVPLPPMKKTNEQEKRWIFS